MMNFRLAGRLSKIMRTTITFSAAAVVQSRRASRCLAIRLEPGDCLPGRERSAHRHERRWSIHPHAEAFAWACENDPSLYALSHHAHMKWASKLSNDGCTVAEHDSTACCTIRIAAPAAAYGPSTKSLIRLKTRADANPVSIGHKTPLKQCDVEDEKVKAPAPVPLPMAGKTENR